MDSPYVTVQVFEHSRYLGTAEQHLFHTNGGVPALQNINLAAFCPRCGEVWLRVLVPNEQQWRIEYAPCTKHTNVAVHQALICRYFPLEYLHNPSVEILKLEFIWRTNPERN